MLFNTSYKDSIVAILPTQSSVITVCIMQTTERTTDLKELIEHVNRVDIQYQNIYYVYIHVVVLYTQYHILFSFTHIHTCTIYINM